jgi:Tfp pilus assembly protein PilN
MIEINLLPSARKSRKARSSTSAAKFDFGAYMGNLTSRMSDPWLLVAIAGVVLGVAGVGAQWYFQGRAETALLERERVAVQDSARYAAVVAQRRAAEAQRDSIAQQIAVISALDGERFIWPHVLDEISRALPTYTWLTSVRQSNPAAPASPEAAVTATPAVALRVIGLTVNVQALTVFMRQLEASPFLTAVTLAVSEVALVDGKEVTEFTLDMQYSKPDPSVIRTVPLSVAVR